MISFIKRHPSALRYISVLAMLSIVLPTVFITAYAGKPGKYIGMAGYAFVAFWGTYEVAKNLKISLPSSIYIGLISLVIFAHPWTPIKPDIIVNDYSFSGLTKTFFSWESFLVMFMATLIVFIEPEMRKDVKTAATKLFIIIFTILAMSIFTKFIWLVNMYHFEFIFFFLLIAIVADTFAYLGGKYLGSKIFNGAKLAPKISPKKTWAGFIIGYVFTAAFISIVGWYSHAFSTTDHEILALVLLSVILPVVSVAGDLIFSLFKRYLGIKDFSNLMPGHGGILDRLDAMSVVVSFIWLAFLIL